MSNNNCCVVGCSNTYKKCGKEISFYSFPGKEYEKERKERWIAAVKRINIDGSPWRPTKNSKICSAHFVGKKVSHIENHPAYLPTIFPISYRKRTQSQSEIDRYSRATKRSKSINSLNLTQSESNHNNHYQEIQVSDNSLETTNINQTAFASKSTQASFEFDRSSFNFACVKENHNEMSTECNIGDNYVKVPKYDKSSGPSEVMECKGFHGFSSLEKEDQLKDLSGVTFETFSYLASFIPKNSFKSLQTNDSLLLFLMRMKMGITFATLGIFFSIHRTTASRMFLSILELLTIKTQNFIFWPDRIDIKNSMPKCFERHYPNTRAIIDCTEIKTEIPSRVDDRVFMYSTYKGCHTFKILIAIAPNGMITYRSNVYCGRSSDTFITNHSGFLKLLEDGDIILADKGFPGLEVKDKTVIVMPPVLHNGKFSAEEIAQTYTIASVRVHVERSIQRIKIFKILRFVPQELFPYIDNIVHICCVLANFMPLMFNEQIG